MITTTAEHQDGFHRWPTDDELRDALSARGWEEEPEGTRLAWCVDREWRARRSDIRVCRGSRGCVRHPVAAMARKTHLRGGRSTSRWWWYCPDHLMGRLVEDGRVVILRPVDV